MVATIDNPVMAKGYDVEAYNKQYEGIDEKDMPNRISEMYSGKNIFVTGGTGFMGKVLIEKVLRDCPGVAKIYMLIRVKKGKDPKERVQDVFSSPLFDRLKEEQGKDIIANKVVPINGDVSQPDLGLSARDRALLIDTIQHVFHMAATIRFDEPLKKAVLLNTRGTKLIVELAKEMKKLEMFAYVSTSYCHLEQSVLEEKHYPPPADPHKIIKCMEWMEEEVVTTMTKKILGDCPNTYAYTKNLSEALVVEAIQSNLPAIILRPSIVIPIWKEPLPGWTDNINGPTGLLIGAGKGVIRTMYCKQEGYADYVPVDIAVNAILVAGWNFVCNKDVDRRIYHLTSSDEIRISWADLIFLGRKITERIPLNGVVWYPGGSMKKSRLVHNLCVLFFHTIPAYFIDAILFLAGYKPVMLRVQERITKGFEVFEYYANNQWQFINTHVFHLRMIMNPREKKIFKIDGDDLDIEKYFECCILAAREYILKEMPDTLPAARRHLRIMYWVDVFTKIGLTYLFFYFMAQHFEIIHFVFYGFFNLIGQFFSSVTDLASDAISNRSAGRTMKHSSI